MCWIGLEESSTAEESHLFSVWNWVDGSKLMYQHWAHGEPNNLGGHADNCVVMNLRLKQRRKPHERRPLDRGPESPPFSMFHGALIAFALLLGAVAGICAVLQVAQQRWPLLTPDGRSELLQMAAARDPAFREDRPHFEGAGEEEEEEEEGGAE